MSLFKKKEEYVSRRRAPEVKEDSSQVFQRNRTITGSASDRINVSSGHRADLESPRTKAHHLAVTRRKVGLIFLIIISASGLLLWLLTQFTARVDIAASDVTIASKIDAEAYRSAVQDYLTANPLQRFRFALDTGKLLAHLNIDHPEVGNIDKLDMGQAIGETRLQLAMRQPVASWTVSGGKYYVDSNGMAFEKTYYPTSVLAIKDDSGIGIETGIPIASNRFLSFVGKVVALAKESRYTVTEATIPANTTRQLEIKLKGVKPVVRLSLDRGVGEQIEDMSRSIAYLKERGRSASYIDVRVEGKAFYK